MQDRVNKISLMLTGIVGCQLHLSRFSSASSKALVCCSIQSEQSCDFLHRQAGSFLVAFFRDNRDLGIDLPCIWLGLMFWNQYISVLASAFATIY